MAVKYGIVIGLITIVLYLVSYMISLDLFLSTGLYYFTLLLYIAGMYFLAKKEVAGGARHFRDIVRPLFICFLVANLIYYIFYYIMITYVNPDIYEMQATRLASGLEKLNVRQMDTTFTMGAYILTYFQTAIGGFIIAALIAYTQKQS